MSTSSSTSTDGPRLLNGLNNNTTPPLQQHTYIASLIIGMKQCLDELNCTSVTSSQLERWAIFIHESMMISSRNYHSVQHVFDLAENQTDPILILGAYFHDCCYHNVDGGLSEGQARILTNVLEKADDNKQMLLKKQTAEDELLSIVTDIFGFIPGHPIPEPGLNEFLSAVIAVRLLSEAVSDIKILAQIACCIEATIPFRPVDDNHKTPMDRLYDRMVGANARFEFGMSEDELVESVQRAALLANRDTNNFYTTDRAYFLDNTWALLPETNESLRHQYLYTVKDFQHAVYKMHGFFAVLEPSVIFSSFRGVPSDEIMQEMILQATRNIQVGRQYIAAKLLALSLLSAFAELTGGDAPMSLFRGDLPSRQHVSVRLDDMLPTLSYQDIKEKCDSDVYKILLYGRNKETDFDIRQSPLAAYLYGEMGDERVQSVLKEVEVYPMNEEKARRLLSVLPREPVSIIAQNIMSVALSRVDKIQAVLASLPDEE